MRARQRSTVDLSARSKRANIHALPDVYLVHSRSHTESGLWVVAPPFLSLERAAPGSDLAQALRDALDASVEGVPDPVRATDVMKPLLQLAGFRSLRAFNRAAVSVAASSVGGEVTLYPSYFNDRDGSRFTGERVVARLDSDQELSEAISLVLSLSQLANQDRGE